MPTKSRLLRIVCIQLKPWETVCYTEKGNVHYSGAIEVNGKIVKTFGIVRYIVGVHCWVGLLSIGVYCILYFVNPLIHIIGYKHLSISVCFLVCSLSDGGWPGHKGHGNYRESCWHFCRHCPGGQRAFSVELLHRCKPQNKLQSTLQLSRHFSLVPKCSFTQSYFIQCSNFVAAFRPNMQYQRVWQNCNPLLTN